MEVLRTRFSEWLPTGVDAVCCGPPETNSLAVGRANGSVELWDTISWQMRRSRPGKERRSIRGFAWVNKDETEDRSVKLFSAGLHGLITEWDLTTLNPVQEIQSHGGAVWGICFDNGLLFAACDDGAVKLFNLTNDGDLVFKKAVKVGPKRTLSIAVLGREFYAGGSDSRITKWSISDCTCEAKMSLEKAVTHGDKKAKGGETLVWALASLVTFGGLASGDSLGVVIIWDTVTCIVLHRFVQHQADVLALAVSDDGSMLFSAGVDAKISCFGCYGQEKQWLFHRAAYSHSHDIRGLTFHSTGAFVSGGLDGSLFVHNHHTPDDGLAEVNEILDEARALQISPFVPNHQVSVSDEARLVLCQHSTRLELWYLQPAPVKSASSTADGIWPSGRLPEAQSLMPEPQKVLQINLKEEEGNHVACCALSRDGRCVVASDAIGTRLFRLKVEELEVTREQLPPRIGGMASSRALFCGSGLLALASRSTFEVIILDISVGRAPSIQVEFDEHKDQMLLLSTAREWLASADASGAMHLFNLDGLQHHCSIPAFENAFPTAMCFDSSGERLIVASSTHMLMIFDPETQSYAEQLTSPVSIPKSMLDYHERICGIFTTNANPHKIVLWGHDFMLKADVKCVGKKDWSDVGPQKNKDHSVPQFSEDTAPGGTPWQLERRLKWFLAAVVLEKAQWNDVIPGADDTRGEPPQKKSRALHAKVEALLLTLEAAPNYVREALPQPFERKRYGG